MRFFLIFKIQKPSNKIYFLYKFRVSTRTNFAVNYLITLKSKKMKNKGLFLRISILLVGILFFYKNSTAQCSNFNLSATQTYDGPNKNDATLSPTATGGSNSNTFSLYKIVNGNYNFIGISSVLFTNLSAGTYNLNVFDTINKCFDTLTVSITDTGVYNCNQLNLTAVKTYDGSSSNDVTMTLSASGGSGAYWFQIFKYNPNLSLIANSNVKSNLSAGTYKFIVHDSISNCLDSFSTYVYDSVYTVNPCSTLSAYLYKLSDGNNSNDVTLKANYTSSTAQYYWYKNNSAINNNSNILNNATTGTYKLIIYDTVNNCMDSFSTYITDSTNNNNFNCNYFKGEIYHIDSCDSNDLFLYTSANGSSNYSYLWSNGSTSNNISGLVSGQYSVIITDLTYGCIDSISGYYADSTCNICDFFNVYALFDDSCVTNDIRLEAVAYYNNNTSSNAISYTWSNGSTSKILNNLSSGVYTVTAYDSINQCTASNWIHAIDSNTKCCEAYFYAQDKNTGSNKTFFNNSHSKYDSITTTLWTFGDGTTSTQYNTNHTYPNQGSYLVCLQIEDSKGCKDTFCDVVYAPQAGKNLAVYHYSGWPYIIDTSRYVWIEYKNIGTTSENATVEYSIPVGASIVSANPPVSFTLGNKALFNLGVLAPGAIGYIYVAVHTPNTFTLGSVKCDTARILSLSGDIDPSNNVSYACDSVVGSYDPNDKTPSPKGEGIDGNIDPSTPEISYLVRFQNEGNWRTYKVRIEDQIDPNFDLSNIKIGKASHPFRLVKQENGKLIWYFDNIHLTPKAESEALSQGYITYTLPLKKQLAEGTQLKNTAYIYFDKNPAIITNTTVNTLKSKSKVIVNQNDASNFNAYFNESGLLQVTSDENIQQIRVFGIDGKILIEKAIQNQKQIQLEIPNPSKGIYLIQIEQAKQTQFRKVNY